MRDEILDILKSVRPEADYAASENFIDDGLLDSLEMMNLLDALEAKYEIFIDGMDIIPENFMSVETIEKLIKKYRS